MSEGDGYEIGQEITTKYTDAPVSLERQYKVGVSIDISDNETEKILAMFRVVSTNDTSVSGVIEWVAEGV